MSRLQPYLGMLLGAGLIGCASRGVSMVLTGQLTYRNGTPVANGGYLVIRDSMHRRQIDRITDSAGRFAIPVTLRRGCNGVSVVEIQMHPIDWHVWVDGSRDTADLGVVRLLPAVGGTGEGTTYLVLECGEYDTVPPIPNERYDTLAVRNLGK